MLLKVIHVIFSADLKLSLDTIDPEGVLFDLTIYVFSYFCIMSLLPKMCKKSPTNLSLSQVTEQTAFHLDNPSHPLNNTIQGQWSSFS